uniref:Uncharacterized protein n=1 Tax=Cairina moschata TaxID=8855 RepID=A0A8C3D0H3_CAIMO
SCVYLGCGTVIICPAPLTVVQLPGEQVQVQGVIQTAQSSSVIHSPQVQTVQVTTECLLNNQESCSVCMKRLVKIFLLKIHGIEKEMRKVPVSLLLTSMSVPTPIYQTSTGQYIAIAANGLQLASPGTDGVQGLQTLTMTNAGGSQPGTTILQYAQTSDGQQILVPSNQVVVQSESKMKLFYLDFTT